MGLRLSWFLAALPAVVGWTRLALAEEPVIITVQGETPYGELAGDPFAATSRVRRERLVAPALRASEALRSEAGIQIAESGGLGAPATASIRGATAAQTSVYLAGVRLNDLVGSVADLSTLPLWLIDHVDVYRGSAPFELDDGSIGGAIVFEPRRPRSSEAAAGLTGGSFGSQSGFGYVALGDDQNGLLLGVSAEHADNDYPFRDNRGTLFDSSDDTQSRRANSDSRLRDAWILGRFRTRDMRFELMFNDVAREQGAPKLALVPSRRARAELGRQLLAMTMRAPVDAQGKALATFRVAHLDTTTELVDPERELGTLTEHTSVSGRRVEVFVGVSYQPIEKLGFGFSVSSAQEGLKRRDSAQESWAAALDVGSRVRADWQLVPRLHLLGTVGLACRGTTAAEYPLCDRFAPTGRLGFGWRGPRATAFLNLSSYVREPALGELYGVGLLTRGNAELRPERGFGIDGGGRVTRDFGDVTLHAEAAGFARRSSDLVAYARTAQGYVVPLNVGSARVVGLELGAGARAFEHLELGCNATLLDPRDISEGSRLSNDILPFTSRLVLSPRLLLTTGELTGRALTRAELSTELSYVSNRFADAAGLIVIPDQTTLSLTGSAGFLSDSVVARARVANLLDAERFDVVGYPLPGRSVFVSAEVHVR